MMLTHAQLLALVRYDPETGAFYRQSKRIDSKIALNYRAVFVAGKQYYAHRLAWFYMLGEWPSKDIDHRDQNTTNNMWRNLRLATESQNGANRKINKNNKTGVLGVYWDTNRRKWHAQIKVNHKTHCLGRFESFADATLARRNAELFYFREFSPNA